VLEQRQRAVTADTSLRHSTLASQLMVWEVTVVIALYFLVKTIKLNHNIYTHDKGGLKCHKNYTNSFLPKQDVTRFAFVGQYCLMYLL